MATQPEERRNFPRYDTDIGVMLTSRSMRISVRMLSVSASGALVRLDRLTAKVFDDDAFILDLPGVGRFSAAKKWRRDTDIGASFVLGEADRLRLSDRLANRFGTRSQLGHIGSPLPQP